MSIAETKSGGKVVSLHNLQHVHELYIPYFTLSIQQMLK